jgi:hypothetical protein
VTVGETDVAGLDFAASLSVSFGPVCRADGWWEHPRPQGARLSSVWHGSATDAWAVGDGGTVLRWDGGAWTAVASGTTLPLLGIWGSSADDAWAVGGDGAMLHWDGSAWSAVASGTTNWLTDVWGASAADVLAVGHMGNILRLRR